MLAALGVMLLLLGEFAVRELACVYHMFSVNVNGCMCDF
jgi:hypothetical protein